MNTQAAIKEHIAAMLVMAIDALPVPPGPRIVTHFVYPPIPDRRFDWSAVRDGYDGGDDECAGDPIGWGRTEQEAIEDLLREEEWRNE